MQEFPKKQPLPIKFISILDNIWRTMVDKGAIKYWKAQKSYKAKIAKFNGKLK